MYLSSKSNRETTIFFCVCVLGGGGGGGGQGKVLYIYSYTEVPQSNDTAYFNHREEEKTLRTETTKQGVL